MVFPANYMPIFRYCQVINFFLFLLLEPNDIYMEKNFELVDGKYTVTDMVSCFDVDSNIKMKPVAFMNIAQEMATRAADELGFGYDDMLKKNTAWVLSRMHFVFMDTPMWKENIEITTWHKGIGGPFFLRDFSVKGADGKQKVVGTSSWVVLDLGQRTMVRLSEIMDMIAEDSACHEDAIAVPAPKVMMPRSIEPKFVRSEVLGYSDTDMNGHTNNARYIQHAMNCLDYNEIHDLSVAEVFITFNHETRPGESLDLFVYDEPLAEPKLSANGKPIVRSTLVEGKVADKQAFCTRIIFV